MNDRDVQRILDEGHEIAALILSRGGWMSAERVEISCRFPAEAEDPALWQIDLFKADDAEGYHTFYTKADSIVGISCRRYHATDEKRDSAAA